MNRNKTPLFAILKASGINRDWATKAALEAAGARADIILIGSLVKKPTMLSSYHGLIIPGGFSYGDDVQSGVILALQLLRIKRELEAFAFRRKRPVIGVCNGFQALIQTGLLPFGKMVPRHKLAATLHSNSSGHFESRWVTLKTEPGASRYIKPGGLLTYPVDHGEGKLSASPEVIEKLESAGQVVLRYADETGNQTQQYPANPNNSAQAIAGICDPSGVVLGMMPHPEDFMIPEHHPNYRRGGAAGKPDGLKFFEQIVSYAKETI
jgi:phosphoribosylformylglycinamidine synthase subunit PurQ / glutaminase